MLLHTHTQSFMLCIAELRKVADMKRRMWTVMAHAVKETWGAAPNAYGVVNGADMETFSMAGGSPLRIMPAAIARNITGSSSTIPDVARLVEALAEYLKATLYKEIRRFIEPQAVVDTAKAQDAFGLGAVAAVAATTVLFLWGSEEEAVAAGASAASGVREAAAGAAGPSIRAAAAATTAKVVKLGDASILACVKSAVEATMDMAAAMARSGQSTGETKQRKSRQSGECACDRFL